MNLRAGTLFRLRLAAGAVILLLVVGGAAYAQQAYSSERVGRIVEALLIWRLTDELDLKETQIARIFPRIRELKQMRIELGRRNREVQVEIRELRRAETRQSDAVRARILELRSAREHIARRRSVVLSQINGALTVEQQVRFLQIQDTFESETIQVLQDLERFIRAPVPAPAVPARP